MRKRIIPLMLLGLLTLANLVGCNENNNLSYSQTTESPTTTNITTTTPSTANPSTATPSTVTPSTANPTTNKTEVTSTSTTTIHVESVSLSADNTSLNIGDTATITVSILPEDATDKSYSLLSSNNEVISIENNVITALKEGNSTITVTTTDGEKTDSIDISVASQYSKVSITVDELPESVTSFYIEGSISKSKITAAGTYDNFYVGDALTGYVNGNADAYEIYIYAGELEGEISELLYSTSGFEIAEEYGESLIISVVEATAKTANIVVINEDNISVNYTVNYTNSSSTLPSNIEIGDWITISITSEIEDGYECVITYKYGNGNDNTYEHGIEVTGDLTITIIKKKLETVLVKIIFNVTKYTDDKKDTGIGNYLRDGDYNYYRGGDHQIKYGETLYLLNPWGASFKVKIVVGGTTIKDGSITSVLNGKNKFEFKITGETTITLSDL